MNKKNKQFNYLNKTKKQRNKPTNNIQNRIKYIKYNRINVNKKTTTKQENHITKSRQEASKHNNTTK